MIDALWRWAAGPALGELAAFIGLSVLVMLGYAWIVARREFAGPFDVEDDELIDELDAEDEARLVGE